MKFKELKTKSEGEVRQMLGEFRKKMNDLGMKSRLNQLKNGHELRMIRRDVARIMTFLGSKRDNF